MWIDIIGQSQSRGNAVASSCQKVGSSTRPWDIQVTILHNFLVAVVGANFVHIGCKVPWLSTKNWNPLKTCNFEPQMSSYPTKVKKVDLSFQVNFGDSSKTTAKIDMNCWSLGVLVSDSWFPVKHAVHRQHPMAHLEPLQGLDLHGFCFLGTASSKPMAIEPQKTNMVEEGTLW